MEDRVSRVSKITLQLMVLRLRVVLSLWVVPWVGMHRVVTMLVPCFRILRFQVMDLLGQRHPSFDKTPIVHVHV